MDIVVIVVVDILVIIVGLIIAWIAARNNFKFIKKFLGLPQRPSVGNKADVTSEATKLEYEVTLESGGILKVSCDTDIFKASQNDRNFINSVLDIVHTYEGKLALK